jgi:general stress protein YciG
MALTGNSMSVRDAGKKGGERTRERYAKDGFYERIGRKGGQIGGQRVRELINAGKMSVK